MEETEGNSSSPSSFPSARIPSCGFLPVQYIHMPREEALRTLLTMRYAHSGTEAESKLEKAGVM